ncbi:MAG: hypothetical protein HWN65_12255 [Candidatus Helarchaeota archaeon]|nr:hypothetical protein [Candidatus Helarchaeota archaeon]
MQQSSFIIYDINIGVGNRSCIGIFDLYLNIARICGLGREIEGEVVIISIPVNVVRLVL